MNINIKLQFRLLAFRQALSLLAHGKLDSANPADGAVLEISPAELTLSFTENLELPLAKVLLTDASGTLIATPAPKAEGGDTRQLCFTLPVLATRVYKVEWKVTPVDSHSTHGRYNFTV